MSPNLSDTGHLASIIIEWDNARLSEAGRAVDMLHALCEQAEAAPFETEFLVLFNDEEINADQLHRIVRQHLMAGKMAQAHCQLVAAGGTRYYELKNKGAQIARGEIVVFVDSDVLLEPGWLDQITAPLWLHADVQVNAGETYMSTHNLIEKAFALHWFFPLRSQVNKQRDDRHHFFANNVAFRRSFFLAHPFPAIPKGMTRGACVLLARQLSESGVAIWTNTAARTSHPAPNGLQHFIQRGLAQGRDWAMLETIQHQTSRAGIVSLALRRLLLSKLNRILKTTFRTGRQVGLQWWQYPAVIAIMWAYTLLVSIGAIAVALWPERATRAWQL